MSKQRETAALKRAILKAMYSEEDVLGEQHPYIGVRLATRSAHTHLGGFTSLVGGVIKKIKGLKEGSSEVIIMMSNGSTYRMEHRTDCCESVSICEVIGDPDDLIGKPLVLARVATRTAEPHECHESGTWTFYTLATNAGTVDIRWLGESNGYYSETVDFVIDRLLGIDVGKASYGSEDD